ncbi:MAG: hypothetical protein CL802_13540 [Citromicrobium sp.]|nr:hypothetical protein [Citromicrobium sp.]|tara:strand:+ start:2152 stop:3012 length:861 start_codon:yes stop_codon:yes gene_type:complete
MSSGPTSLEAAHAEVIDKADAPAESGGGVLGLASDPQQLDLLRDDQGKLPSNVFRLVRQEPEKARGPGRPKGSTNKASKDLAKLIGHKYGDPVEFQASIYAMPLDQLCELILVADGTMQRREQLDAMLLDLAARIRELARSDADSENRENRESIDRLADACEALESVARAGAGKPGDIAIKLLNLQLLAASRVSEYVHSKKPTEHKVEVDNLPTLVMAAAHRPEEFDEADRTARMAGELLAAALKSGKVTAEQVVGLQLRDGQLIHEGEFVEVADGDDDAEDGDDD